MTKDQGKDIPHVVINEEDLSISIDEEDLPLDPAEIKLVEHLGEITVDFDDEDMLSQIKIIDEATDEQLDDLIVVYEDEAIRETRSIISAQNNHARANEFCKIVRNKMKEFDPIVTYDYSNENQEFAINDLTTLTTKWHIPAIIWKDRNHYLLVLRLPEDGKILVYDPMLNGERWVDFANMPNIRNSNNLHADLAQYELWASAEALQAVRQGSYDLSLSDDASRGGLGESVVAKNISFQTREVVNCGPFCVFAAAIRAGMHPEYKNFYKMGRDQVQQDTGITIWLKDEVDSITK